MRMTFACTCEHCGTEFQAEPQSGHRLLCGDATNADDVAKVLGGAKPHLMVTDPPYGVDYDPDWRNRADRANGKPYGGRAIGLVLNDDRSDWREAWALFPGDVAYAWHPPGAMQVAHHAALVAAGFEVRMQIIWAKQQFPIGRGNYHVQHEPCWYAVRKSKTAHWQGDRTQSTLWQIDKPVKSETGHGTQKPVECMKRPIENNSKPGDGVYDPFVGSGTTIIPPMSMWLCCVGRMSLAAPRSEASGQTFAAVKQDRESGEAKSLSERASA
jgi:DNA modification methylase